MQKAVKIRQGKIASTVGAAVYAKQFSIYKRSILSSSLHLPEKGIRAKTLLDQPLPTEQPLKPWRQADEFTKLAAAAAPLYWMARSRGWELKTFTLILSQDLHDRLDRGDSTALQYIRDQMTRLIPAAVSPNVEFLYAIEKAPAELSAPSSRRRWHLHGLMIGPAGFSVTGKTPLRVKLRALKGEADPDLMFQTPGEKINRSPESSAMSWCFYSVKNGLAVELNPALTSRYELPPGKQTFVSSRLKREAQRWHEGKLSAQTVSELISRAPEGMFGPTRDIHPDRSS
ncbi:hypothetical protein D3C77_435730 [compost metagenome]